MCHNHDQAYAFRGLRQDFRKQLLCLCHKKMARDCTSELVLFVVVPTNFTSFSSRRALLLLRRVFEP